MKEFFLLFLLLETGLLGVFVSLDLILFYVFWEIGLVPMYFLIGIWGGAKREYAAIKFFLYTLAGSVFMLLGSSTSTSTTGTFSIPEAARSVRDGAALRRQRRHRQPGLLGHLPRLCHQAAAVAVPHLAAGRAHRGADGRLASSWPACC